jgi:hypothetical protein
VRILLESSAVNRASFLTRVAAAIQRGEVLAAAIIRVRWTGRMEPRRLGRNDG